MPKPIVIAVGSLCVQAELNDSPCARALGAALPLRATASTWGDEVYFRTGLACDLDEGAREELGVGELAYWPPGQALCIFFGPTPASELGGAPRAASEVNPIGWVRGDSELFRHVRDGQPIAVEAAP